MDQGCGLGTFLGCGFILVVIIAFVVMVTDLISDKRRKKL